MSNNPKKSPAQPVKKGDNNNKAIAEAAKVSGKAHAERKAVAPPAEVTLDSLDGDIEAFANIVHERVPKLVAEAVATSQLSLLNDAARAKFLAAAIDSVIANLLEGGDEDEEDEEDLGNLSVEAVAEILRQDLTGIHICGVVDGLPRFAYDTEADEVIEIGDEEEELSDEEGDEEGEELEEDDEEELDEEDDANGDSLVKSVKTEAEIRAAGEGKKFVLVDMFATWCKPCVMIAPHVEAIAKQHAEKIAVVKVNVDKAEELVEKFKVAEMPTFLIYANGKVVDRLKGASGTLLMKLVEKHLQ